jgi:uncharacterized repeat protein (TIGR03803 family)
MGQPDRRSIRGGRIAGHLGLLLSAGLGWVAIAPALAGGVSVTAGEQIYAFQGPPGDGGYFAMGGVVVDPQKRLYGATHRGGAFDHGTIYRLTPPASGSGMWSEETLHSFSGKDGDGAYPVSSVLLGSDGSIYGTTPYGGKYGRGMVFSLRNAPNWPLRVLHSFGPTGAGLPQRGVVFGADGALYGTTPYLDDRSYADTGTDFRISFLGDSVDYAVLHRFGHGEDGIDPVGLARLPPFDPAYVGAFTGATDGGPDAVAGQSTVYALNVDSGGRPAQSTLYTFGPSPDVSGPTTAPILGVGGIKDALFGCAQNGGLYQGGIYRIAPSSSGGYTESVIYAFGQDGFETESIPGPDCSIVQGSAAGMLFGISTSDNYIGDSNFFGLTPPAAPGKPWTYQIYVQVNEYLGLGPQIPMLRSGNTYYVVFSSVGGIGAGPSGSVVAFTVTQ